MGGANADEQTTMDAYRLGEMIAKKGWVLLNGGRNTGVMAASAKGAADHGGLTVGILPESDTAHASEAILIPICTGMGSARNMINVLSSDVVVACKGGAGTISEIALALKHAKQVITLNFEVANLFKGIRQAGLLHAAQTPEEVVALIEKKIQR